MKLIGLQRGGGCMNKAGDSEWVGWRGVDTGQWKEGPRGFDVRDWILKELHEKHDIRNSGFQASPSSLMTTRVKDEQKARIVIFATLVTEFHSKQEEKRKISIEKQHQNMTRPIP